MINLFVVMWSKSQPLNLPFNSLTRDRFSALFRGRANNDLIIDIFFI